MSSKVMNNKDLRWIVLSYLQTKPDIVCCTCKKTCVWNKKVVNRYIELPILDYTQIFYQCIQCNWIGNTRDIMGF